MGSVTAADGVPFFAQAPLFLRRVPVLLGASFWSKCWLGGWWSGAPSHTLMAADVGSMALWRLDVRCTGMDSRRRRLLFGVMVASMAEWPDMVDASI